MTTYRNVVPIRTLVPIKVKLNGQFLSDDEYTIRLQTNEDDSQEITVEVNKK